MAQPTVGDTLPYVFLSASIPDVKRHERYIKTADLIAIREAVRGLCSTVLPRGVLVFGGHPAISPLVLTMAERLGLTERVQIFQSRHFAQRIPKESLGFQHLHWTDEVDGDQDKSLEHMRREMLSRWRFHAGVFIGGMEGIEQEHAIFEELNRGVQTFPVASTGAAALELFERGAGPQDVRVRDRLLHDLAYGALFATLLFGRP